MNNNAILNKNQWGTNIELRVVLNVSERIRFFFLKIKRKNSILKIALAIILTNNTGTRFKQNNNNPNDQASPNGSNRISSDVQ